jgi:exopolyphosphatase/pppGpp-phosphohydrolase
MWFDVADCRAVIANLLSQTREQRAANACIGKDRADLVVIGGAILDAVLRVWPAKRMRVADRGLREGVLMRLMAKHGAHERRPIVKIRQSGAGPASRPRAALAANARCSRASKTRSSTKARAIG